MKKSAPHGRYFPDPTPALLRARKVAEELARRSGVPIIDAKDGKVVKTLLKPRAKKARATKRSTRKSAVK